MPIRMMVGLLLLKRIYNLGDETVMDQWLQNPYYQYFCGESVFQWQYPCDPSDMVHFRKRIGKKGVENIFRLSVELREDETKTKDLLVDSTAQEKNITYPTDAKLLVKVIKRCNKIADAEQITQRQSYRRTIKKLMLVQRFAHHPKRKKKANAALRKLGTLAGRLVRELERKLSEPALNAYASELNLFHQVISQKRSDTNKIYSLHEPEVACIAKGKAHKKFEFGSKVGLAVLPKTNIVVGVVNFRGNPNDSQTLEKTLKHSEKIIGRTIKTAIVDRGFRGKKKIGETEIIIPDNGQNKTAYEKRKKRKQCQSRAAIEPVIGHIKHDHRMLRNYLKGTQGDQMNATLAAAAFNFKRLLRKIQQELFWHIDRIKNLISLRPIFNLYLNS